MFTEALFTITKTQKQHKCPSTDEWIKKMLYAYTMNYYLAESECVTLKTNNKMIGKNME